jgi:hypothetical protein
MRNPFKCPVCVGVGTVAEGFYGEVCQVGKCSRVCRTCGGRGIVWSDEVDLSVRNPMPLMFETPDVTNVASRLDDLRAEWVVGNGKVGERANFYVDKDGHAHAPDDDHTTAITYATDDAIIANEDATADEQPIE